MASGELPVVIDVWYRSLLGSLEGMRPDQLRSEGSYKDFFRNVVAIRRDVWVAELDGEVAGVLALCDSEIDRLYVAPEAQGRGVGTALLDHAKSLHPAGLTLVTHERNIGARRFYERHGFEVLKYGTSPPPENEPDVEYRWLGADRRPPVDVAWIRLRPLLLADLDWLYGWRNDLEVTRHLAHLSMTKEQLRAWFDSLRLDAGDRAYAILVEEDFVGYAVLTDADPINEKCEAGIIIGDKARWGQGIGSLVARELARIAFTEVGMHRVLAVASERNPSSIRCFERAGFREEGRLRQANLRDGEYFDLVLLSLLAPEWRRGGVG
jgi:RimJ/RimL family protein N-acetyltransferase